ncbi:SMP-30/gluconolactonase/LRE family protein [Geodermatophilus sabuli]|uniref:SMP-30/Gluconolaconase/LRE-like region-containing protein n=1 Tax=Geodermatophilus sabuli TaxID=1564158 RepID=A0A285ECR5_9ACTN|nr:SMP-30/gluconolactonase/LRE family protein [Geodermatophilus sabuli]MBB3085575.1 hypothetical protein [Geodermatophilus sabuli]SNX96004.1 SMP-30/Gluconolaconase/LRE-like region-containing protein [Geodermatophilus sabuli]
MTKRTADRHLPSGAAARKRLRPVVAACVALPALLATTGFGSGGAPGSQGGGSGPSHGPELSFIDTHQPPEDIIALPGTSWVVISAVTGADHPGGMNLVNTRNEEVTPLWPAEEDIAYTPDLEAFPGCTAPPDEALPATHGINTVQTGERTFDLYVVYHGGRESIEVFSLDVRGKQPTISWRGCVVAPEGAIPNSVVALPDGGIAMTKFWDSRSPLFPQLFSGEPSGSLWTWHRESGWAEVPGSQLFGPNGIEVSEDGATLYTAETMKQRVVSIPTAGGDPTELAQMDFLPDNLRWTEAGTLLTTGQEYVPVTPEQVQACAVTGFDVPDSCIPGFDIVEIDPVAGTSETVFSTRTTEYRYTTVAAPVGREIWVGGNAINSIAVVSGLHRGHSAQGGHR